MIGARRQTERSYMAGAQSLTKRSYMATMVCTIQISHISSQRQILHLVKATQKIDKIVLCDTDKMYFFDKFEAGTISVGL